MTDVSVGFITPSGMLISATAPTAAEALQQLVDIFGEDVAAAYEQALSEVEGIIADADPRGIAPGVPAPQPAGGNDPGAGGTGVPDAPGPGVERDVASGGEGQEAPVVGTAEANGLTAPASAATQPCSVCGTAVPEGLAALSVEQFGDTRCRACGQW